MEKKERNAGRDQIIADFQFYIGDKPKEIFGGMTGNISPQGLCFLTTTHIKEGQTITITKLARKNTMPDFNGQRAKIMWVKKESRYLEAGAKFNSYSP